MARTFLTSAVLGTAFAAAIGLAPAAAAEEADEVSSRDTGRSSSQQAASSDRSGPYRPGPARTSPRADAPRTVPGWQNDAVWARPGPGSPNLFGGLPKPPIYALD